MFLSNGPGDPAAVGYGIETIKKLLGVKPIFGICLGHQLLALSLGAKTFKLKFGHRGINHPVKNINLGTIEITSQNHGFAVDLDSLPKNILSTHINLNDNTSAGIECTEYPAISVQYHPESSPVPHDSRYLFKKFIGMMDAKRTDIKSILIIGAGPIVVSQACEFDYSGTQAAKALRDAGYKIILVNSNPATIMTDPEIADCTYIGQSLLII